MKAAALVVVRSGVAHVYASPNVRCQVVDLDNLARGDALAVLPAGIGFEELAADAGLVKGKEYIMEDMI